MTHSEANRIEVVGQLATLRTDFDALRRGEYPIRARLLHKATNAECYGVQGLPPDCGASMVAHYGAGSRESAQRFDESGQPTLRASPLLDVTGTAVEDDQRRAYDVVMPAFRSVSLYGSARAANELATLADRGGRIARGAPTDLWKALGGWRFHNPAELWWSLLFELAWSERCPVLSATRQIWAGGVLLPYDSGQLCMMVMQGFPLARAVPSIWCVELPEAFVSDIRDTATACRDLCDYLLTAVQPPNSVGSADAGKPATKRRRVHRRTGRSARGATPEMVAVKTAKDSGVSFREIAKDRRKRGLKGTSVTTLSTWYRLADAELNPKPRSVRARSGLPTDRRGQPNVPTD